MPGRAEVPLQPGPQQRITGVRVGRAVVPAARNGSSVGSLHCGDVADGRRSCAAANRAQPRIGADRSDGPGVRCSTVGSRGRRQAVEPTGRGGTARCAPGWSSPLFALALCLRRGGRAGAVEPADRASGRTARSGETADGFLGSDPPATATGRTSGCAPTRAPGGASRLHRLGAHAAAVSRATRSTDVSVATRERPPAGHGDGCSSAATAGPARNRGCRWSARTAPGGSAATPGDLACPSALRPRGPPRPAHPASAPVRLTRSAGRGRRSGGGGGRAPGSARRRRRRCRR